MIKVVYASPRNLYGGWVTFTAHLMYGFGDQATLYRIPGNPDVKFGKSDNPGNPRSFGYGIDYRTTNKGFSCKNEPCLITAIGKQFIGTVRPLLQQGAWVVIHDPNEFGLLDEIPDHSRIITIRKSVQRQIPGSKRILHPYRRQFKPKTKSTLERHAVSIARIDFDKHTEIILGANKLLPKDKQIELHGWENRLYGRFKLAKQFPEWMDVQSTHKFPREDGVAAKICNTARYAVDLSVIKNDGGGTQYTFLEAMDGGAVNVLHRDWLRIPGEMKIGKNCLAVRSEKELVRLLLTTNCKHSAILEGNEQVLRRHDSNRVATEVMELMKR